MRKLLWVLSLWLLLTGDAWGAKVLRLRGYAEALYARTFLTDWGALCDEASQQALPQLKRVCDPNILYTRIRPSMRLWFNRKLRMRTTVNLLTSHFALEREVKSIWDILTLERLYMDIRTRYVDIRVGKQALQWGPAVLWSLTVPYNPQNPTDLNAERPGLWGVNLYWAYNPTGGIRAAVLADPDIQKSTDSFRGVLGVLRWKHTFGTTEVGATALYNSTAEKFTFGLDVKGTLVLGLWAEAVVHVPYRKQDANDPKYKDYDDEVAFAAVVGLDYSFPVLERLYFVLQYHYTSKGLTNSKDYPFRTVAGLSGMFAGLGATSSPSNVNGLGISTGGSLGAHYLFFSAQLGILEELGLSALVLANILDPSMMTGLTLNWTFLTDFSLNIGAYFMVGPDGSEYNPGKVPKEKVEPGSIPIPNFPEDGVDFSPNVMLFVWLRYNF